VQVAVEIALIFDSSTLDMYPLGKLKYSFPPTGIGFDVVTVIVTVFAFVLKGTESELLLNAKDALDKVPPNGEVEGIVPA